MSSPQAPRRAIVEDLLATAHESLSRLLKQRALLQRRGIPRGGLPDDEILGAFALLGDHEADNLREALTTHWPALRAKGLVQGALAGTPAPELRLISCVLEYTATLRPLLDRLQDPEAIHAPAPPSGVFQCARAIRGLRGQAARIHFLANEVDYLLIAPENPTVFGCRPTLVAAEPFGQARGIIQLPIDSGVVNVTLLHNTGKLYRHRIDLTASADRSDPLPRAEKIPDRRSFDLRTP